MTTSTPSVMPRDDVIRLARPADLPLIMHLQDHWRANVSYIRRIAHAEHIDRRDTLLVWRRGMPAGYVLSHPGADAMLRVCQVAVDPDVLRTTLGSLLMDAVHKRATLHHCLTARLSSRIDLPANHVWPELGYVRTGQHYARTKRRGLLNEWTLTLPPPYTPRHAQAHHP